jgi:hypothetical protein
MVGISAGMFPDPGRSGGTWDTLVHQAPMTAELYFDAAIKYFDELGGKGFALKHPALLASYVEACARDFHSATLAKMVVEGMRLEVHIYKEAEED